MMYSEKVLNEFFNTQNVGVIKAASGKGKVVSPVDREIMKIYIQVEDGKIIDAAFQTFGCVAAIASTNVATRLMIGKTVEEAEKITANDILTELGGEMPEIKMHCVEMAEKTVKDAVKSYRKKQRGEKDSADNEE